MAWHGALQRVGLLFRTDFENLGELWSGTWDGTRWSLERISQPDDDGNVRGLTWGESATEAVGDVYEKHVKDTVDSATAAVGQVLL